MNDTTCLSPRRGALLAASLLLAVGSAWAQTPALEDRMGQTQFRAAGLHKLDPAELQALDAWIAAQSVEPAARTGERGPAMRRDGDAGMRAEPVATAVSSTLVGRFEGFSRGREYTLANGQVWRQTGDTPLQGVRADGPAVEITPARLGGWWMRVAGYNTRVRVERVR